MALPLLLALLQSLENGSFEEVGSPPPGWTTSIGATNGALEPTSEIEIVSRRDAPDGRRVLELSGKAWTRAWTMLHQDVPVRPGERVTVRAAVAAEGLLREGIQFDNAYVGLFFRRGEETLGFTTTPRLPEGMERGWCEQVLTAIAPEGADVARVGIFLSKTGVLRVDDVRLEVAPADAASPAGREAAFDALAEHLLATYSFWGVTGRPDDPERFLDGYRRKATRAKDVEGLCDVLEELLRELGDVHVSLQTPEGRVACGPRPTRPTNWSFEAVDARLGETVDSGRHFLVARLPEGPGYARVTSWSMDAAELDRLDAALDRLADAPSLVIDVRPNGGGDETQAARVAARFAAERTRFAASRWRDPCGGPNAFGAPIDRYLAPREGRAPDLRPVVVLQGPFCVSSNEAFCLMAKALPTVTTVGLTTRGASGNPGGFDVLPGVTVYASRWQSLDLEGKCIEGVGVPPEVEVDEDPSKYRGADPTFERALEILASER